MEKHTKRLFPASNANLGPKRIAIIKVQISGSPGIFHSVASMVYQQNLVEILTSGKK